MNTNNQTPVSESSVSTQDKSSASTTKNATVTVDDDAAVIRYLQNSPDFFQQHPDVLLQLDIPHAQAGDAQSLIERQVDVLRERQAQLEQRFSQVVQAARDNESLQEQVHQLVVQLAGMTDSSGNDACVNVRHTIESELKKLFDIEHVSLRLIHDTGLVDNAAFAIEKVSTMLQGGSSVGNEELPADVAQYLFDEQSDKVMSYALLPVRAGDKLIGVAALGASDAQRFSPDQATTYLDRIAQVLSANIARLRSETTLD